MKKPIKPKAPPAFLVKIIMGFVDFLGKLQQKILPPQAVLLDQSVGGIVTHRCVYVAAELGIADLLKNGSKSIDQLAQETGTDTNALYRIMRTLCSVGIFKERKKRLFETNKLGKYLQSDLDDTIVHFIKVAGAEWLNVAWGSLMQTVKNGKDFYQNNQGINVFEWLRKRPKVQKQFDIGMTSVSALSDIPVTAAYNFSTFETIVDVGGGYGTQILTILNAFPKLKGILFELPYTIDSVKKDKVINQAIVERRLECIAGDFFISVPAGYDAYFMKSIIHDWDDEKAVKILTNCRKAMPENSTLLIVENIGKEDSNTGDFNKFLDIYMLALFGGVIRTSKECSQILKESGFELKRVIPTASIFTLLEAKPI